MSETKSEQVCEVPRAGNQSALAEAPIRIPAEIPEIPYDTRPISKQEFMSILRGFQSEGEFSRLPLPAWCYKELPEYKGTELERLEENAEYAVKQAKASTEEERLNNMKERLKRRLETKKAAQK